MPTTEASFETLLEPTKVKEFAALSIVLLCLDSTSLPMRTGVTCASPSNEADPQFQHMHLYLMILAQVL